MSLVTANLTAVDTVSDPVAHSTSEGDVSVSISGTFVATLVPQRSLDGGQTWADDDTSYTAPAEINIIPTEGALYRVYCSAYTSGTAVIKLL